MVRQTEMSISETEKEESIEEPDLEKPYIVNDIDLSLMTSEELRLIFRLTADHEEIVKKRAEELRFYPDTLTEEERDAVLSCLTFKEMKPAFKADAIFQKNLRLMKKLSVNEKVDVRIYHNITLHFSEYGPRFKKEALDDESIFIWTERYLRIMRKHEEQVFEEPYYYLTAEQKKRVLKAGAKLDPEEYLTREEMEEMGIYIPKKGEGFDGEN